jgi:hypothetical protein
MSTFATPASKTPFDGLPAELSTRIFDYVFAGRSPDVAKCRLACQNLHTLSSPYLIRTVVVAERLEALQKLREVMLHPYFSKYVTHLTWDSSHYELSISEDYSAYEHAFENSEHLFTSKDAAYVKAREADAVSLRELRSCGPRAPRIPRTLRNTGDLLEYGVPAPTEDEEGFKFTDRFRGFLKPENVASMPDISGSSLYRNSYDFRDGTHMKGCHLGFPAYRRRWENQHSIRGGEHGYDGSNLGRQYFLEAVWRLPKLRHLSYSDYRALAMNDESYVQLCQRMFGQTVCPSWLWTDDGAKERFHEFLDDLSRCSGRWDSLSIGRHPFETNCRDLDNIQSHSGTAGQRLPIMTHKTMFEKLSESRQGKPLHLPVRTLRLPLLRGDGKIVHAMGGLSNLVTSALVELDIGSELFHGDHRQLGNQDDVLVRKYAARSKLEHFFGYQILHPQHTPDLRQLRSLTMRGFIFDTDCLTSFLMNQAPGLQTLRLMDCYCMDTHRKFLAQINEELGPYTERGPCAGLTGVEIFGLRFHAAYDETADHEYAQEYRGKMQKRAASTYERCIKNGTEVEGTRISNWPFERPEVEAAMLGGRVNSVLRTAFAAASDEARWYWYNLPNSGV